MFLRFGRLFFLGLLVAGASRAADPAAQARELFQRGQQALAQGKSQQAIEIFDQAYRAGNSPSLLFYLGEAYRQKGENAKAIAEYRLYLDKMPTGPKRAEAEARVAELEKQPAVGPALTPQGAPVAKRKLQVDALDLEETPKPAAPAAPPQRMVADDLDLSLTPPPTPAPAAEKTDKRRRRDRKSREKEAAEEAALAAAAARPPPPVPTSPALELPPPPPPKPAVVEIKDPPLPLLGPIPKTIEAKPVPPPPVIDKPLPAPPTIVAVAPAPPPITAAALRPLSPGSAEAPYAKVNPPAILEHQALPEHASDGSSQRTAGVAVGVVGLAALAAGGAFGLGALNAANDLTADAQNGRQYNPSTQSRGQRDQHLEIGFIAGGGALVVTGVLLWALSPSSAEASASSEKPGSVSFGYASVAPVPGGAAASAGLRF